jgi:hypothetical protein
MKHDEAAIREILRLPGDEQATEQIGIPPKQKPAV